VKSLRIAAVVFFVAAAACSVTGAAGPFDGGDEHAADASEVRTIAFAETGSVTLRYRETYGFLLRVTSSTGGVAGLHVDLALDGDAQDSSLSATALVADGGGEAAGSLIAGTVRASFSIRASLSTGETARLDVRVEPPDEVMVTLAPVYAGARATPTYEVGILPGDACPAVPVPAPEPAGEITFTVDASDPSFAVPRELILSPLRIAVTGQDRDARLTWGCADEVVIPSGGLALSIDLRDLPWPAPGAHAIEVGMSLAGIVDPILVAVFVPFAPVAEEGVAQGTFVVDGIVAALRDEGRSTAADVLQERRTIDDLDDDVEASLADAGIDLAVEIDALRASVDAFLAAARATGVVELGEADPAGAAEGLDRWLALTDGESEVSITTPDGAAVEAVARAGFSSDRLELRQHRLPLSLGRLVLLVLDAGAGGGVVGWATGLPGWLADRIPCADIAALLAVAYDLTDLCDIACLESACLSWRDGLARLALAAFETADADFTYLNFSASCGFLDATGRLAAGGRCEGDAVGQWEGLDSVEIGGPFSLLPDAGP
jgi:hypothetical protein